MKRPITLAVALVLALGLAACGGSGGTTAPTSGGNTTAVQSGDSAATQPTQTSAGTSAPAITTGSGEVSVTVDGEEYVGNYDGEYADGLFSGYGVWEFESWRYEGYWENGLPNGEGKLTWATTFGYEDYGMELPALFTSEGLWVDGFASGTLTETQTVDGTPPEGSDNTHQWIFENVQGGVLPEGVHQCVLCSNEFGLLGIREGEIQGVPPWSWEGQQEQSSDTPPTQSTGGDTQGTTTPAPGTDVQDIPDDGTPVPSDDSEYLLFADAQIIEDAINNQNEYFCPTTDDYITYYDDIFFRPNEDEANDGVDGLRFGIVSFDENGDYVSLCEKFVFETPELAELFANTPNRFHDGEEGVLEWDGSTDVFCHGFPKTERHSSLPFDTSKANLIAVNIDEYSPRTIIEISKP